MRKKKKFDEYTGDDYQQDDMSIYNANDMYYDPAEVDDDMEKAEKKAAFRDRMRMAAGLGNFASVLVGVAVILVLVLLLVSLLNWVSGDIFESFTVLQSWL